MNAKFKASMSLFLKSLKRRVNPGFIPWIRRGFASPSPQKIKMRVLERHGIPGAYWIETGTYLGETTKILSKIGAGVVTIEPQRELFNNAKSKLSKLKNIEVLYGTSEDCLDLAIKKVSGEINFWLDGHYSGDITFKGDSLSPIEFELRCIEKNLSRFESIVILIDDIRVFPIYENSNKDYPTLGWLIDWTMKNDLTYQIEHDIFIIKQKE